MHGGGCLERMTDANHELDREAERRWRRGSIEMVIIFMVLAGFSVGIFLVEGDHRPSGSNEEDAKGRGEARQCPSRIGDPEVRR
jgi:hypothetical protein